MPAFFNVLPCLSFSTLAFVLHFVHALFNSSNIIHLAMFLFPVVALKRDSMKMITNSVHPLFSLSMRLFCLYFGFASFPFNTINGTPVTFVTLWPASCLSFKVKGGQKN